MEGVAQEDRWMLEMDQDQIMSYTVEDKQFWINAVNAAMRACANLRNWTVPPTVGLNWCRITSSGRKHLPKTQRSS